MNDDKIYLLMIMSSMREDGKIIKSRQERWLDVVRGEVRPGLLL